eukprot:g21770.t1
MLLRRASAALQRVPHQRLLSTQVVAPGNAGPPTASPGLSELSERAGFVPRPPEPEKDPSPGFRGGKALFIFFLCNAIPFSALMYYLREQREKRTELAMLTLPRAPEEVAAEVLRVIRTSAVCFLLQDSQVASHALRVDPHLPEATAYVPPTGPLPLVPQMERNFLTERFGETIRGRWENFSECGTGKAKFFSGYPAVFREVLGQYGGHLANVGVTVWPGSCGHGVIVLATTHCSIEHSISAR